MARPRIQPEVCTAPDCDRPPHSRNLCKLHHRRLLRTGTPDYDGPQNASTCIKEGCEKPRRARDLCKTHWMAWSRAQQKQEPEQPTQPTAELSAFLAARRKRLAQPQRRIA